MNTQNVPYITREQAKFLLDQDLSLNSNKLYVLASANRDLMFDDEENIGDFIQAVLFNNYEVKSDFVYLNLKQPDNIANNKKDEQFIYLNTFIDPETKSETNQIDFVPFEKATLFSPEMLEELPECYKIYTSEVFRIPEVEAVQQYGDYNNWLMGKEKTKVQHKPKLKARQTNHLKDVQKEINPQKIVEQTLEENRIRDEKGEDSKFKNKKRHSVTMKLK